MVRHLAFLLAAAWLAAPAFAQLPSQASLTGVYNVRYLGVNNDLTVASDTAVGFSGTLTFDGNGNFTVAGQGTTAGAALKFRTSGKYTVISSGMVFMDNPFDPVTSNGTQMFGGMGANGAITASSTDSFYSDLFVAIPAATGASAATLTGTYRVASMEFLNGDFLATRDTFFSATADGKGALGNVTIQGTALTLKSAATTQTSTGATYTVTANGSGTLVLPAPSGVTAANTLLSGTKTLYVSTDGSFFIAGSPTGYDMEIGVKTGGANALDGLYWNAFLENFQGSTDPNQNGVLSGQGTANEIAAAKNLEIAHQRVNIDGFFSFDSTSSDNFPFDANGLESNQGSTFAVGANGSIAIGAGVGTDYFLWVFLKAPTMTPPAGTTVFLNPQGVANGASSSPVSAQVSPGEIVTLFGSGMGPTTPATAAVLPFPTTLGGVQVLINGSPAPVYFVSATQISAVVPYNSPTDGSFVTLQVVNGTTQSNVVKVYSGTTSPGLFTIPPGGPFDGAIQHSDFSLVSSSSPAKAGETVIMYLTGLGPVSPAVSAGAAAPTSPLSKVVQPVSVFIDGIEATVQFQGLTPGLAGLYQLNVTVPAGVSKGSVTVEIVTWLDNFQTPDVDNFEASMTIG